MRFLYRIFCYAVLETFYFECKYVPMRSVVVGMSASPSKAAPPLEFFAPPLGPFFPSGTWI